MASAQRRGNSYAAVFRVYDFESGEGKQVWKRGFAKKKDAIRYGMEREGKKSQKKIAFKEYCKEWYETYGEPTLANSILSTYMSRINKSIYPISGEKHWRILIQEP